MSSRGQEVEVTISSARDTKNVNWRNGPNKPYAVVWIDPKYKSSTRVDEDGDTCPTWNETFVIPLPPHEDDYDKVYIDIVHAGREENTKPLIGSAHLSLRDVIGLDVPVVKTLELKRPSGRPHGKLDVTVTVREPPYHPAPGSYHAPPYGHTHAPPPPYSDPYAPPPPYGHTHAPPQTGYSEPYPPPPPVYGESYAPGTYGNAAYGQSGYGNAPEKGSKFGGMGTGLAVGAVAGVLGGVALAEGLEAVEDNIAEKAAEKVENDLDSGEDDYDDGDF
ncbi:PREDICTED: protein SRC2 homolog [Camelina sativa]|uniref:Protein SRC2 homolog n=1 Tax=Camelina sativa TaxID=90675 RepID=A0ABM0T5K7_CAMSA|nr:PREDICTED: protein SRC2 homolog [Camelina sativa]